MIIIKIFFMVRGGMYTRYRNGNELRVGIIWKCQVLTVRRRFGKS